MTDRLFFALWPDDGLREVLARRIPPLLTGIHGKTQRPDQWHVTLEFLGAVPAERQSAVWSAADKVDIAPSAVEFDALEHWRKSQVYCLSATRTPGALSRLVAELRAALMTEGFVPESREFRPHLTLARKVRSAHDTPLPEPIHWPADAFALVRSVTDPAGSRYEPLRWWNLHSRGG